MKRRIGNWSLLSGPDKDGSRHGGIRVLPDAARQIRAQGHVVANKMYERSVDREVVSKVRISDILEVRCDGAKGWWVWRNAVR